MHRLILALGLSLFITSVNAEKLRVGSVSTQVVLLHGLARSSASMEALAVHLQSHHYQVCNVSYPSTDFSVEVLAAEYVVPAIRSCFADPNIALNFVTHSMGGIIVRQLVHAHLIDKVGRVVMLAPPNHGSEIVDRLGELSLFQWLNGPAGSQLGTSEQSLPQRLGPAAFELGIIAGNSSINLLLSMLISGDDDGKVSIESAKLEGMADFKVVASTHPFIMKDRQDVWPLVLNFLRDGRFETL
ncbi:MAG: esterase/lipase family protein [Parahaliea sp.]